MGDWELSYDEIDELLTDNPSLRSFVSGYAAEMKCRRQWFENNHSVTGVTKYDDHDRAKKGDIAFTYRGELFTVEVKSLQTNHIKRDGNGALSGKFQCDASDRRTVTFPDGSSVETTCLLVGEFDLLAVNLHGFYKKWVFAFAKNSDLPRVNGTRGRARAYTQLQRDNLLATLMPIGDPPDSPYRLEPWSLLDELVKERRSGVAPKSPKIVGDDGLFAPGGH
ncbi:hypothetical protein [Mycobacteroides abscessus]|uniref:hypothetical protein n=1 Tax=Mycobacteroides abscessus TaxID=36809 RepID=UPI00026832BE|nr:hypothetical protein [Mycobacteroides abscessus]EIT93613.1 restriction endonuclease [Mycobacteroides abscessus 4S-0726-RA]EIU00637.1 restriction endonuclease [Mycobacteroides abscessus 4S-0303]